ncbi:MAG: hypothetical protein K0V04_37275 [Deltaproteobacteria bacterium]|nr:hypothetical protein [Deltaproteobacteria bacterium]
MAGCGGKKPPGTTPPSDTGGTSADGGATTGTPAETGSGGSSDDGGAVADPGAGGGDGPAAPTTCDAKIADTPTLLFNDQVILRPPHGVEFVPDGNPMVQQAIMSGGFMSACDALIKRMLVTAYEVDKKRKPAKLMDEFITSLESQGYTGGKRSSVYLDTATDYHLSVEYGGGGGSEATVLYLAVARRGERDFIVVIESTPGDFKLLRPTFEASAKSLFIVPPDA